MTLKEALTPTDADLTVKVTFDAERFKAELHKRITLSSANDMDAVIAEMGKDFMRFVTIGDILDAEFLEVYQ